MWLNLHNAASKHEAEMLQAKEYEVLSCSTQGSYCEV